MHFSTPILALALSAATSANPITQRSTLGSWAVTFKDAGYANGWKQQDLTANYTSDSYPAGIVSTCKWVSYPEGGQTDSLTCEGAEGFAYEYHLSKLSLQQSIELPNKATVFGTKDLVMVSDMVTGRVWTAKDVIEVTSATA
ncbi:hypothetical protein FB567DRAFT_355921 [Paraphoma chrysanthemicola]|uniref:Uncharacterized protein n=1 Tax=Paraphoma chrysanthemicola TaxID=798071 RepID=A0A8K0VZU2_9PLEO|nr:hypothetical protein FB567DRAFT_355921 [Paraphoma chrysanthemicola]